MTTSPLRVPPPQFGRSSHPARPSEEFRTRVHPVARLPRPEPGTGSVLPPVPPDVAGVAVARVPGPLADFGARTVSFLIDFVAPVVVLNLLLALGAIAGDAAWRLVLVTGLLVGFGLWNSGYLQGTTGRSLGRRVANTKLVLIRTGEPVGVRRAVIRQICHVLEFGIGYLWPLWDGKCQTFADKIAGTVVVHVGPGSP